MSNKYVPFGPEWEADLMKMTKKEIIALYRNRCLEVIKLEEINDAFNVIKFSTEM